MRDAGPARAAVLIGTAPIISAVLAVVFLGEPLRPALGIAMLLIVAGGALLAWERERPAGFKAVGAVLALACAVMFAARDNVVRFTVRDYQLEPLAATTVTLAAAGVALSLFWLASQRRVPRLDVLRMSMVAFAPAGISLAIAYAALVIAFDRGRVTVVAPLNATQSLWAVALSAAVLGRSDAIGRKVLVAAVLVVVGSTIVGATR